MTWCQADITIIVQHFFLPLVVDGLNLTS